MIVTVLAVVVVGALAFFGGMKFQEMQTASSRGTRMAQFGGQLGMNGQGAPGIQTGAQNAARIGMRQTAGEIISADEQSVTVKMADGSTKIVLLTGKSTVSKSTPGAKADLKVGEKVAVFGTENTDGSITAESVQLNPVIRQLVRPTGTPSQQ